MTRAGALAAGAGTLALVTAACSLAWRADSPLVPRDGGTAGGSAPLFLILLVGAFVAYLVGLDWIRRAGASTAAVAAVAAAIQLVPLGAPLLLSTDAWTYWSYGWIAARSDGNPYVDPPGDVTGNPALPYMGAAWVDTTSVYGPAFTLLSEPVAVVAGSSNEIAAWSFKAIAAVAVVAAALLAGRLSRRRALAVAFVGWNPVLAVHLAGGGHNDALLGALLLAALALSASRRLQAAGAFWALAVLLKWVPLLFLALRAIEARASGRRTAHAGFGLAFGLVVVLATWRYGLHWVEAVVPLASNAALETSFALPHRLEQVGLPDGAALAVAAAAFVVGVGWLVREARRGRARLGLASCLVLATSPYLAVWYLGWAVPLAGGEDDDAAKLAALALTAYLLPQTIPL
ncbi:MAG: glycosyltransferase 87 family protein [Gaiellaceae bacterium]